MFLLLFLIYLFGNAWKPVPHM